MRQFSRSAILHKLLKLFGDIHPTPELLLQQPDEAMRAAGLSKNKMLALQDLARKTLDGTVPGLMQIRKMADEEIISRLTAVRGVGVWTVEMLLIFRLGRRLRCAQRLRADVRATAEDEGV